VKKKKSRQITTGLKIWKEGTVQRYNPKLLNIQKQEREGGKEEARKERRKIKL
jgi:hypothetical protein